MNKNPSTSRLQTAIHKSPA